MMLANKSFVAIFLTFLFISLCMTGLFYTFNIYTETFLSLTPTHTCAAHMLTHAHTHRWQTALHQFNNLSESRTLLSRVSEARRLKNNLLTHVSKDRLNGNPGLSSS